MQWAWCMAGSPSTRSPATEMTAARESDGPCQSGLPPRGCMRHQALPTVSRPKRSQSDVVKGGGSGSGSGGRGGDNVSMQASTRRELCRPLPRCWQASAVILRVAGGWCCVMLRWGSKSVRARLQLQRGGHERKAKLIDAVLALKVFLCVNRYNVFTEAESRRPPCAE